MPQFLPFQLTRRASTKSESWLTDSVVVTLTQFSMAWVQCCLFELNSGFDLQTPLPKLLVKTYIRFFSLWDIYLSMGSPILTPQEADDMPGKPNSLYVKIICLVILFTCSTCPLLA